jgi:hypothetical protein
VSTSHDPTVRKRIQSKAIYLTFTETEQYLPLSIIESIARMKMKSVVIGFLVVVALGRSDTNVPTQSPSATNATSIAPTMTNSSIAPSAGMPSASMPPSSSHASNTTQPTPAPSGNETVVPTPTPAPSESNTTEPPSVAPSMHLTEPPTIPPTSSPSAAPSVKPSPHKKTSIGKIVAKTLGWLLLIALSVLLFGAAMSNRYQIYYALRGVWYTILQMECTRWIMTKLNLGGGRGGGTNGSLNEIIFDNNDLTEGLLMGDT